MYFYFFIFIGLIFSTKEKVVFKNYGIEFILDKSLEICNSSCANYDFRVDELLEKDDSNQKVCINCINNINLIKKFEGIKDLVDRTVVLVGEKDYYLLSKSNNIKNDYKNVAFFDNITKNNIDNDVLKLYVLIKLENKNEYFEKTNNIIFANRIKLNNLEVNFFTCKEIDSKYYLSRFFNYKESEIEDKNPRSIFLKIVVAIGIVQFMLFISKISQFIYKKSLTVIKI